MYTQAPHAASTDAHACTVAQRTLWAVSDLHVAAPGNLDLVRKHIRPRNPEDWLIVAGDIAEDLSLVIDVLSDLRRKFNTVIFAPGNHEIYGRQGDRFTGKAKYNELIRKCRQIDVLTPEDDYPVFDGRTIVPLFTLYDHSWRTPGTTPQRAIGDAQRRGVVLTDHYAIAPFVDIPQWCRERLRYSVKRLSNIDGPTILVNHWPLVRELMKNVYLQDIGLWSGTRHTQQWPQRYRAEAVIHGHLHIPVKITVDSVPHVEVSLGYPKENQRTLPARQAKGLWPYPVLRMPTPKTTPTTPPNAQSEMNNHVE